MKSFPVGSRFLPKDLGLVRFYLRNMVERKQSSFITTMDVYMDEPWLLPHVNNPLFKNKEWYYFVQLTKRRSSVQRKVPGRGGSEGGTWRSNDGKEEIKDGHQRSDEQQKLVLCRIRYKKQKKVNKIRRVNHQAHQTQADLTGLTDELEKMPEGQEDREEQEEVDLTDFPDELETMLEGQEDCEQQQEAELTGFSDDPESMLLDGEEDRDVTQQQQQQQQEEEIPQQQQQEDDDMMVLMDNPNDALALGNYEFVDLTWVDEISDTIQRREKY
ncbi:hypothetical protein ARALYDRAFT_311447 [Arabidopsis lyrata subsp. lyrata]|uniref:NAC domain-containing protein n=1 Tax=Arabidopsis lyrata subsp. lyrata TaxID=81972 RepID=D7KCF5_ARALL|nr:hypothetical protein ARALYDRAFT_311447 [Arabidopsis lyrata subsp. lyrata]